MNRFDPTCSQCGGTGKITATDGSGPFDCFACRDERTQRALDVTRDDVAKDRHAVLQLLYEAHHREPCGPTLQAISAAIQHLQAVDGNDGNQSSGNPGSLVDSKPPT
jgi:hypothetical protein